MESATHSLKSDKWRLTVLTTVILLAFIALFFFYRLEIARLSWNIFHRPVLSITIAPNALLVRDIGNYYFGFQGIEHYDIQKARRYFELALLLDSAVPDAWHQLARIDFLGGYSDEALRNINTQIDMHGDALMASFYVRGLIHGYRNEFDQAEQDFLTFLSWNEKSWAAHNDLAWIYFRAGEYEKMLTAAERGLAAAPTNVWLLNMKGVALLNVGRKEEAGIFFERARAGAALLTEADWRQAYPGNDPAVATEGLRKMREAIQQNRELAAVNN